MSCPHSSLEMKFDKVVEHSYGEFVTIRYKGMCNECHKYIVDEKITYRFDEYEE